MRRIIANTTAVRQLPLSHFTTPSTLPHATSPPQYEPANPLIAATPSSRAPYTPPPLLEPNAKRTAEAVECSTDLRELSGNVSGLGVAEVVVLLAPLDQSVACRCEGKGRARQGEVGSEGVGEWADGVVGKTSEREWMDERVEEKAQCGEK